MELTGYIAIYAAILSTVVFFWNVQRSIPKIKVILIGGLKEAGDEPEFGIFIEIKNHSPHTVHLTSVDFLYPYKNASVFERLTHMLKYRRLQRFVGWVHSFHVFDKVETGFPVSIEPWNSHSIFVPDIIVKDMLSEDGAKILVASVQDALWRTSYSNVYLMHTVLEKDAD